MTEIGGKGFARDGFQSTQPSQAVTGLAHPRILLRLISIHTALAGCDVDEILNDFGIILFQSTQPSQAVTDYTPQLFVHARISIHTALAGCDLHGLVTVLGCIISIHTALAGCDLPEDHAAI